MIVFKYDYPLHNRKARKRLQRSMLRWLFEHNAQSSVLTQRQSARLYARREFQRARRSLKPTQLMFSNSELMVFEEFKTPMRKIPVQKDIQ